MAYKVLVAMDSTGLSELALKSLSMQAAPDQTEVLVVEVVEPILTPVPPEMSPGFQPEMATKQKELKAQAKDMLDAGVEVFRQAGFKANSRVVENAIKEGIIQTAVDWGADLIVVTAHSRKGMAKFFHRSVAKAIVHEAPCSVLVVKELAIKVAAA